MDEQIKQQVLDTLAAHRKSMPLEPEEWTVAPYEDAYLVQVAHAKPSAWIYLVRGDSVVGFSPDAMSAAAAYNELSLNR